MNDERQHSVLVVDDERVIREGCNRLLCREGYRVLTADNGREALDLLSAESVDLVLCDLVMPVMGALEVLEVVKSSYPDLPLIIITGHATISNAVEAMKRGAYDFVTKPFRADHLILVVQRALKKRVLEHRARRLQEDQFQSLHDLATEKSRIKTIVNCMADGVLVTNRNLEVVLYNPALSRLFDLPTSMDEPIEVFGLPDTELGKSIVTLLDGCAEGTGLVSRDIQRGDKHLHAVSAPVSGLDGAVMGTVTVFQDFTALKELDEMKSHFVQTVSHELRSPLASIQQLLAVILEGLAGDITDKQKELLNRSRQKIQDLLELISDLLDVAKIESGHGFCRQVPLKLVDILERTVTLMKSRAESQKVCLKLEIPSELPLIRADPQDMEQLFTNLISNAVNYSPDGGETCVSVALKKDFIEVVVSDTGIGIEPKELPKIFDKFYRCKHPKTRHVRGTGLGLAIVKTIVESHQGFIKTESQPGIGTTFRVLLPIIR